MNFGIRWPYLLPNVEHEHASSCHPLWRLVAINCLMFHARTAHFADAERWRLFSKAFFQKRNTNSRRAKFSFTWKRFASHAYECTRNVFPIFLPRDNQLTPNFSAIASVLRAVTHVVCGKIFTLWSALCSSFERKWENKKNGSEILWAHRSHFYRMNGLRSSTK